MPGQVLNNLYGVEFRTGVCQRGHLLFLVKPHFHQKMAAGDQKLAGMGHYFPDTVQAFFSAVQGGHRFMIFDFRGQIPNMTGRNIRRIGDDDIKKKDGGSKDPARNH